MAETKFEPWCGDVTKRIVGVFGEYKSLYNVWSFCAAIYGLPFSKLRYAVELRKEPGVYYITEDGTTDVDTSKCRKFDDLEQAKTYLLLLLTKTCYTISTVKILLMLLHGVIVGILQRTTEN